MRITHALLGKHAAMHPLLDLIERTASMADRADRKTQARFLGATLISHTGIEVELLHPAILEYPRSLHLAPTGRSLRPITNSSTRGLHL